jgi:hypothetical protein
MNRSSSRQESDLLGTWSIDAQALLVPEKLTHPMRREE